MTNENIFIDTFIKKYKEGSTVTAALRQMKLKYKLLSSKDDVDRAAVDNLFTDAVNILRRAFETAIDKFDVRRQNADKT